MDKKFKKGDADKSKKEKMLEKELNQPVNQSISRSSLIHHTEAQRATEEVEEKTWYLDYKGNKDNLLFGELYRLDIPDFKRKRFCLGLKGPYIVSFDKRGKYLITPIDGERTGNMKRYVSTSKARRRRDLSLVLDGKQGNMSNRNKGKDNGTVYDFIPLEKVEEENDQSSSGDEDEKEKENETEEDRVQETIAVYNRRTRENPRDVSLWLDFLSFQDRVALSSGLSSRDHSFLETKAAINEKALDYNPNDERLLLQYMRTVQSLWEKEKLVSHWEGIISENHQSINIWKEYLNFNQSTFSLFSVSMMRSIYTTALENFARKRDKLSKHDYAGLKQLEYSYLDFFRRFCVFEKQTGYTERSIAYMQAIVEYNFFSPFAKDVNEATFREKKSRFQAFWDSNAPKFGEKGAQGWNSFSTQKQYKAPPSSEIDVDGGGGGDGDEAETGNGQESDVATGSGVVDETIEFAKWYKLEQKREEKEWLPLKISSDNNDVLDPERVCLFDDIGHCLFEFYSEDAKLELLLYFVEFLIVGANVHQFSTNHMRTKEKMMEMEDVDDIFFPDYNFIFSQSSLPCTFSFALYSPSRPMLLVEDESCVRFIRNVFDQSIKAAAGHCDDRGRGGGGGDHHDDKRHGHVDHPYFHLLLISYVRFERSLSYKSAVSTAKSLLSAHRNCISLWLELADVERLKGNISEARRILDTTLTHSDQLPRQSRSQLMQLYFAYADLEVFVYNSSAGQDHVARSNAIQILIAASEGKSFSSLITKKGKVNVDDTPIATSSPITLVKTRNNFQQKISEIEWLKEKERGGEERALHTVMCAVYFDYLTLSADAGGTGAGGGALHPSVSQLLDTTLSSLLQHPSLMAEAERLYFFYVRLMYSRYVYFKHTPPREVRKLIETSLTQFPSNIFFLSIFIDLERRSLIENRVRRFFDNLHDTSRQDQWTPIIWLFAIRSEISKLGSLSRIRSLFEKALHSSSPINKSIVLWRSYMEMESNQVMENSKKIFFRAIDEIPYSKKLWLDCVGKLRKVMTPQDLKDLFNLMSEKEIRRRTELDEISS